MVQPRTSRTNGALSVIELVIGPASAALPAQHSREDELWVMLDGSCRV